MYAPSLPTRERELKHIDRTAQHLFRDVAPHAGARIETPTKNGNAPAMPSLPTRERELKRHLRYEYLDFEASLPTRERELKLRRPH